MHILWTYLRPHARLALLSLLLAALSQVPALIDPIIFGKIIDQYAIHRDGKMEEELVSGVLRLLALAVGVAIASRLAKALQEYFTRLVVQRFGTQNFNAGLRQVLRLKFPEFEDLRSGETLSMLQKVRAGSERFINAFINTAFAAIVGIGFLVWYAVTKHWLSIAHALAREPRLLIFDEATSALDSLTEEQITATVREISARSTQITILIAHRLSMIMHAGTIHVLEKGRIVESGTHAALLEGKGLYYAMWRQQIGERPVPRVQDVEPVAIAESPGEAEPA